MQVLNADAMVVKLNSGELKTIHLSSIRPPRIEGEVQKHVSVSLPVSMCVSGYFSVIHVFICVEVWGQPLHQKLTETTQAPDVLTELGLFSFQVKHKLFTYLLICIHLFPSHAIFSSLTH